jgi:hypothetical protein
MEKTAPSIGEPGSPADGSSLAWVGNGAVRAFADLYWAKKIAAQHEEPFSRTHPQYLNKVTQEQDAIRQVTQPRWDRTVTDMQSIRRTHGLSNDFASWHAGKLSATERLTYQVWDDLHHARMPMAGTDDAISKMLGTQMQNTRVHALGMREFPSEWNNYKNAVAEYRSKQQSYAGAAGKALGSLAVAEVGKIVADRFIQPDNKPGMLTAMTDIFSPALLATPMAWRYKILGMVGAHVAARLMD